MSEPDQNSEVRSSEGETSQEGTSASSKDSAYIGGPRRPLPWQAHVLVSIFEVEHDLACVAKSSSKDHHQQTIADAQRAIDNSKGQVISRQSGVLHPLRWLMGGRIDSAYRHLHCAEVMAARLLPEEEIYARTPDLVIKYKKCLRDKEDDRLRALASLTPPSNNAFGHGSRGERDAAVDMPNVPRADGRRSDEAAIYSAALRSTYDILDQKHTALRSLRNGLLLGALIVAIIVIALCTITWITPTTVPLCFRPSEPNWVCASNAGIGDTTPSMGDIALIAFFGLMGASLSSAIAISRLPKSRESYTISYALAVFKLPLGALTAVAGLLLIHGRFIPGLSELDTQQQILAYSFVFGFAQIIVTRLIDRQARDLIGAIPEKEESNPKPANGVPTTARTQ